MPSARFWLIDLPARIVDLWLLAYRLMMIATVIAIMAAVTIALVLAAFGIRWGW